MKRNIIIIVVLILCVQFSIAQDMFNRIYDNGYNPNINNVFQTADTGYVALGGAWYNDLLNIDINYFNTEGEWIWNKHYGDEQYNIYHGVENSCIKIEGGYILAGGEGQSSQSDSCYIYLIKFNEEFDTLWTRKHFVDTSWVVARGICNTADGGFMVVGETKLTNDSVWGSNYQYGLMLKLDAEGQYEWFKSYGTDNHNDVFYKVVQTPDGGYLVGGGTKSWQEDLYYWDRGDWYLVKTDSLGQEEWSRQYGNPELSEGRVTQILMASDTSYYLTGAWAYDRPGGTTTYTKSYIVKLDSEFNDVYQLINEEDNKNSYVVSLIETEDNNLVSIDHCLINYSVETRTTMTKMTPEGETLWQRQFVGNNDTIDTDSYGMSIIETSDKGFLFGGRVFSAYISPYQQMWLVKTDSLGCDGTNDFWDCSTDVKINTYASNKDGFSLYPNPANSFVVIEGRYFDILRQGSAQVLSNRKVKRVGIYDVTGKLVKNIAINEVTDRINKDVSYLESGVYMVKVGDAMQRLVVE